MKKMLLFLMIALLAGCKGTEPLPVDDGLLGKQDAEKPVNGILTLKSETLNTDAGGTTRNEIARDLNQDTQVIIKNYTFKTGPDQKSYMLSLTSIDSKACASLSNPQFLLTQASGTTLLITGGSYILPANTDFRLQFYVENVKCNFLRVTFLFRQL